MTSKIYITLCLALLCATCFGQSGEQISVPLSNPSTSGELKIYNHNGTIDIRGYDGSTVEVEIDSRGGSDYKKSNKLKRRGLKRIPNKSMGVSITEEDNYVKISASNNNRKDYVIKVPKNFSLQVSTHHNGQITISDVIGSLEVNAHHGGIKLENVAGAVIADTHHGEIEVTFTEIYDDYPMAFTTYHGDVDIAFPAGLNADLKMKSAKGDIYTDFDFEVSQPEIEKRANGNRKEIKVGGWTRGRVGSGGVDMLFDTYHGDVIIRKN